MNKTVLFLAIGSFFISTSLTSCASNCMGKGVNTGAVDDIQKENYIMTAEDTSCVEVY